MARYFDRVCRVVVEGTSNIVIENCKITFSITKSSIPKENSSEVEIYNLSPKTRSLISQANAKVFIFAGYKEYQGLVQIGQGDISKISTTRTNTDVITMLFLSEGLGTINNKPVMVNYDGKIGLATVLDDIAKQTGLGVRVIDVDTKIKSQLGYSDIGALDVVLNNLASKYNFTWSIQNGVLLVRGLKLKKQDSILLLTPKSGLILAPESLKDIKRDLKKSQKNKTIQDIGEVADYVYNPNKHKIKALLQPQLAINDVIAVESEDIKGSFRIHKIMHKGDTRGNDWYTDMELISI